MCKSVYILLFKLYGVIFRRRLEQRKGFYYDWRLEVLKETNMLGLLFLFYLTVLDGMYGIWLGLNLAI